MTKCIIFDNPDGTISIRGGVGPRTLAEFGGDIDAALNHILTELVPKQNPDAINPRIVDRAFPSSREFRAAWEDGGAEIGVNMPKARAVHMDRIRKVRNARLDALDIEIAKAEDGGGNAAALRAQRQKLRDIPQTFRLDGASTPEALKALWPNELPSRAL